MLCIMCCHRLPAVLATGPHWISMVCTPGYNGPHRVSPGVTESFGLTPLQITPLVVLGRLETTPRSLPASGYVGGVVVSSPVHRTLSRKSLPSTRSRSRRLVSGCTMCTSRTSRVVKHGCNNDLGEVQTLRFRAVAARQQQGPTSSTRAHALHLSGFLSWAWSLSLPTRKNKNLWDFHSHRKRYFWSCVCCQVEQRSYHRGIRNVPLNNRLFFLLPFSHNNIR